MFWTVFILSLVLLALALLAMSVQILFSKRKSFPDYRIGHNKEMRKRNIYCPKTMQKRIDKGIDRDGCGGCY